MDPKGCLVVTIHLRRERERERERDIIYDSIKDGLKYLAKVDSQFSCWLKFTFVDLALTVSETH